MFPSLVQQQSTAAPGVAVHCFYSYGLPTPVGGTYQTDEMSDEPTVLYGTGDATVHIASLSVCERWPDTTVCKYKDIGHAAIITDPIALGDIVATIKNLTQLPP